MIFFLSTARSALFRAVAFPVNCCPSSTNGLTSCQLRYPPTVVTIRWKDGTAFEAEVPTGAKFVIDSHPDHGGRLLGPTPLEALLSSVAACSAIDVLDILKKKRQKVTSYRVEVEGDRPPPGDFPRSYTAIRVKHILGGENLDPDAVARAVDLSDSKYCTVITTLRKGITVTSDWEIEDGSS
jgi:putative redox protein